MQYIFQVLSISVPLSWRRSDVDTEQVTEAPRFAIQTVCQRDGLYRDIVIFRERTKVLEKLHGRVAKRRLPETNADFPAMVAAISTWTTPDCAHVVAQSLYSHSQSRGARIVAFRASIAYSFTNNELSWIVIQWRELDETEVLGIFLIENDENPDVCSWVMHFGVGQLAPESEEQRWATTSITWNVSEVECLKSLFVAAQTLFESLEWTPSDALTLYGGADLRDCSQEEFHHSRCR